MPQKKSDKDIILSNLLSLTADSARITERRVCELYELASVFSDLIVSCTEEGMMLSDAVSVAVDMKLFPSVIQNEGRYIDFAALDDHLLKLERFDRVVLSKLIAEHMSNRYYDVSVSDFIFDYNTEQSVVYMRNPLSDEAYEVFSESHARMRVSYADSVKAACQAVHNGEAGYCIVPLEEGGGERIGSIFSLICELDLKIVGITPVFGFDGNADTKYALVSASLSIPKISPDDDTYIEISLAEQSSVSFSDTLAAAESLGMSLYRTGTRRLSENGVLEYSLVLLSPGETIALFLLYLYLFRAEFSIRGIYTNLE